MRTKGKLAQLGNTDDDFYPLCYMHSETINHLFFDCIYSNLCCEVLEDKLGFKDHPANLEDCNTKLNRIQGRFGKQVVQSCYAGLLYCKWEQRNKAVWEHRIRRPEKAIQQLIQDLYHNA